MADGDLGVVTMYSSSHGFTDHNTKVPGDGSLFDY